MASKRAAKITCSSDNRCWKKYAKKHPGKLVVYSAGAGVLLWVLEPWRLLSATTVVTLLLSNTDVAGLLSGAIKKISGPYDATR